MSKFVKIILISLGVLGLIFAGIYVYVFYAGGIENFFTAEIDGSIGEKYNLDIAIGEIEGNLLSGIVLRNIVITFKDSAQEFTLARIPRLEAHYSLSGLLAGSYDLSLVQVDSAQVWITQKDSGGYYLPRLAPGGFDAAGSRGKEGVSGSIDELIINNASVFLLKASDTISFSEIYFTTSFEADKDTYAADLERFSVKSNRDNFQLDYCSGKITFAAGVLSFQDLNVGQKSSRVKLNGQFDIKQFHGNVALAADNLNISELSRYGGLELDGQIDLNGQFEIDREGIEGSIDLGGEFEIAQLKNLHADLRLSGNHLFLDTVYGTILDMCAIDGRGEIDFSGETEKYELRSSITGFNLNSLIGETFESELNGDIYLQGSSFRTKQMVLEIDAGFYESTFDGYHLHSAIGSMQITSDSIFFREPFIIEYYENIYGINGKIEYKNQIDLEIAAQLNDLERYQGKLFIDKPAGRGFAQAKLTGKTSEPNLKAQFESDSVWIYGLFSTNFKAEAEVDRFLTGKKGIVNVTMSRGSAWDIPVDTGFAILTIDSNLVNMNGVSFRNEYSSLEADGLLDYGPNPMRLSLDTLSLQLFGQEFYNRGKQSVDVDSAGFDFKRVSLGHNEVLLGCKGLIGFDQSLDLNLEMENVIVSPWMKLFEVQQDYDGSVSGWAKVLGDLSNPNFQLELQVDSLKFRDVLLGELSTNVKYNNQLLNIDSLILISQQGRYKATGTIPMDLSLVSDAVKRLLDNPMNLHISAADKRFDLVTTLLPSIEQLEGDFFADFRIFGTPNDPHIEGMAYLKNAKLKYFDLEQLIYADSANVVMEDNRIIIDNIEAYTFRDNKKNSAKRFANLEGEVIVKALDNLYYDIYLTLPREFPFTYELADIRGTIEGEMHIEGDTPPLVSGNLSLVAMRYGVNFASPEEGSPIMAAFSNQSSWNLNLNIEILSNYWIKNDDIDAQFTGFLNLVRDDGQYRFIGEIEAIRGRGYLYDKIFTLEPGGTVTFEGGDSLNPRLNLVAYTRTTSYVANGDGTSESVQLLLEMQITGTLDYPEINPTENSEVSGEELLPFLAGTSYGTGENASFGTFEQRISGLVATQFSQIGSKQLRQIGVETFEIDPAFYEGGFDIAKTRVTLGFYSPFDPNLYLYGRSALGSSSGQELGFEYRLYKRFQLEGRRDEDELYHLNLKLHWEF
jgi:autotransporter translocation and assembly factor TamB